MNSRQTRSWETRIAARNRRLIEPAPQRDGYGVSGYCLLALSGVACIESAPNFDAQCLLTILLLVINGHLFIVEFVGLIGFWLLK